MQYLAAHFWQSANHDVSSMTLQQVYHKKKKMPVVLACICTDAKNVKERKRLVTELTDWFYEIGLPLCDKHEGRRMRSVAGSLEGALKKSVANALEMQVAGVFCVGKSLILFQKGSLQMHLLNTRNLRTHSSALQLEADANEGLTLQEGWVQPGIGVLLTTKSFENHVTASRIEECLNIREIRTEERMERRLRELGQFGEARGAEDIGAVLLLARE